MREDWKDIEISAIFDIVTGNTPSKKSQDYYNGAIPFVKPPNLWNATVTETEEFLSEKGALKSRLLPPFSTLVTCIGNLGRVGINKNVVTFNQQINAIKPTDGIDPYFTFYQAQSPSFKLQLESKSSATTVAIVNKGNFGTIMFKVAPLPEQRTIVAKIEELFSSLDSGIADLQKAQEHLKIFRQAVLKKAFDGEFEIEKLVNLTSKIGSGSTPNGGKANYKSSGIPLIRSMNIHFNYIKFDELAFIDDNQAEKLKNVIVQKNDVLLNITGASIGRINIAPKEFDGGRVNQHVSILRTIENKLLSKYLKYFIESPSIQKWINEENYGVTRQALTKSMIENLEVPLPTIEEQRQIVQEIESRLSVCDKVEENILENLEKAKALRQSILKKAFEGKLLSEQELKTCRAAPDYEPAGALLERIERSRNERIKKSKN